MFVACVQEFAWRILTNLTNLSVCECSVLFGVTCARSMFSGAIKCVANGIHSLHTCVRCACPGVCLEHSDESVCEHSVLFGLTCACSTFSSATFGSAIKCAANDIHSPHTHIRCVCPGVCLEHSDECVHEHSVLFGLTCACATFSSAIKCVANGIHSLHTCIRCVCPGVCLQHSDGSVCECSVLFGLTCACPRFSGAIKRVANGIHSRSKARGFEGARDF